MEKQKKNGAVMMKTLFATIFVFFLSSVFFCQPKFTEAIQQKEIMENPEKYPELQEYARIFFENIRKQNVDWQEKFQKIIDEYKNFINKYPRSEFTDEAKLRIAEFYQLLDNKEKSFPYLNDIIANYPNADYFSLGSRFEPKAKTAGWALYYRGLWFLRPNSINDWEKLLEKYPGNKEAAQMAKSALRKYEYLRPREDKKEEAGEIIKENFQMYLDEIYQQEPGVKEIEP